MESKILSFQFEPVSTKPTHPSYNDGNDQDEPQKLPPEVFCKKKCSETFCKTHCARVFVLKNFIKKETLAWVLFYEFYEISKNTFFTEHIRVTASGTRNAA